MNSLEEEKKLTSKSKTRSSLLNRKWAHKLHWIYRPRIYRNRPTLQAVATQEIKSLRLSTSWVTSNIYRLKMMALALQDFWSPTNSSSLVSLIPQNRRKEGVQLTERAWTLIFCRVETHPPTLKSSTQTFKEEGSLKIRLLRIPTNRSLLTVTKTSINRLTNTVSSEKSWYLNWLQTY